MPSTTIRVSLETRDTLQTLSKTQRRSIQEVAEAAVEVYRRQQLLSAANRAYTALRADGEAQRLWEENLAEWDETLTDGLGPE